MQIEQISLKNFKAFQNVTVKGIQPFTVLVGANGTGKTSFFDVFGFLRDCLRENVRTALARRGGFKELITRGHESKNIFIELQIRMDLHGKSRLVTYSLEIGLFEKNPIVERETLRYKRGRYGAPYYFLDFRRGEGQAITNEKDAYQEITELVTDHQKLGASDILAIKGLGQFQRFEAASALRSLVENWHVSDFYISSARNVPDAGVAEHLSTQGENLPLVAQYLYEEHRPIFERILKTMSERVPGIKNVTAEQTVEGRVVLRFQDGSFKDPFIARFVSDGTIKMFAYLILLNDPKSHPLLCVEEPENQLYPSLLAELAEEFASYAKRGGQVFVSTHSPDFLNAVPLSSIFWLSKTNGLTAATRAQDNERLAAYVAGGDKPGWLWQQGAFEGADPDG